MSTSLSARGGLARCLLFAQLDPRGPRRPRLRREAQDVRGRADRIFAQARPEGVHVVVSGRIKIFVLAAATGREFVLSVEHPYQAVAELPSLDEDVYPASAQAIEASETLFLEQEAFNRMSRLEEVVPCP